MKKLFVLLMLVAGISCRLQAQAIIEAEYFFDADPGQGLAIPITITTSGDSVTQQLNISTTGLAEGPHHFCLRTKNNAGQWSLQFSRTFYITAASQPGQTVAAEYFFDADPGPGNGTPVIFKSPADSLSAVFYHTNTFTGGTHTLVVRSKDAGGQWSLQAAKNFNVCSTYGANSDFSWFIDRKTVYFNNLSTYDTAFKWMLGDGATTTTQRNPAHRYNTAGVKTVSLFTFNKCATDTATMSFELSGLQSINAAFSADTNEYVGHVRGIGFLPGCKLVLRRQGTTLTADTTIYISSTDLKVKFNFRRPPQGWYDVILLNQPAYNDTLFHAFEIQPRQKPSLSFKSSQYTRAVPGVKASAHFRVRNTSNITLYMIPFYIFYDTTGAAVVSYRGNLGIIPSIDPALLALKPADNTYWIDNPYNPDGPQIKMVAGLIPYLAPNQSFDIYMDVTSPVPACKNFKAMVGNPLDDYFKNRFNGNCDFLPNAVKCALDVLAADGIPGCLYGMMNIGCTIGNEINDALWDSNKHDAWDIPINVASTLVTCATVSYAPIGALGKGIHIASSLASNLQTLGDCSNAVVDFANWDPMDASQDATVCHRYGSYDPNAKYGPVGATAENYVNKHRELDYTVAFENVDTAAEPAAFVRVKDKVDSNLFDLSTFRFSSFGFGDTTFYVPDEFSNEIVQDIDLRSSRHIWLRVMGKFDSATGDIDWTFTSLDTATYALVSDTSLGFLPPNVSPPQGQGYISYEVRPRASVKHGDVLQSDSAVIIFDANPPILTNEWKNTVDTIKPASQVQSLTAAQNDTTFRLYIQGSDADAGIMEYTVYASENDSAYKIAAKGLPYDSMLFTGKNGSKYLFFSQAHDRAFNSEDTVHAADAMTVVTLDVEDNSREFSFDIYPNPGSVAATIYIASAKEAELKAAFYAINGRKMKEVVLHTNRQEQVSLAGLAAGLYYIRINGDKPYLVKKMIVIR